jgi:hypothetical protein
MSECDGNHGDDVTECQDPWFTKTGWECPAQISVSPLVLTEIAVCQVLYLIERRDAA